MSDYNPFNLIGKTILVTGASSGIGRAIAIECSRMGATVVITARNKQRLLETMSLLEGEGHNYISADITSSQEIDSLCDSIPKLDGLVNNAGFTITAPIQYITEEKISTLMLANSIGPILLTTKLLKRKKINKNGSIVFTSSICGTIDGVRGNSMYGASKGAISGFVKTAALELANRNIRVNAICPGMVDTGILDAGIITKEQLEADSKSYPLGRYGKPEEIAYSAVFLLSDAAGWITGSNLIIDGGKTINS